MFEALGILFIMKLYVLFLLKLLVLKEVVTFERSVLYCLHASLSLRSFTNLHPNLQKPPSLSKMSAYVSAAQLKIGILNGSF